MAFALTPITRTSIDGSQRRSANAVASRRRRKHWQRPLPSHQLLSTCLSAGACLGTGRRIMPICSKVCARLDGRTDGVTCRRPIERDICLTDESSQYQENIKLHSRIFFPRVCILLHIGREHRGR